MQITREELEAQGIFIPSEVNDELLARFRVGSKILISTYFPEIGLVNLKIQHSYECIKYRELLFENCKFILGDVFDNDLGLFIPTISITMDDFNKIITCLEKNC